MDDADAGWEGSNSDARGKSSWLLRPPSPSRPIRLIRVICGQQQFAALMRTVDERYIAAPPDRVFAAASDVERWPAILSHYRWVRTRERGRDAGAPDIVEMAAWRPFGPIRYPTWWVSEMWVDAGPRRIRYRHIDGITRGMDVEWRVDPAGEGTRVVIVHEWEGPAWPLIRRPAAEWIIGPVFVHGIASRTLAGIAQAVGSGNER